VWWKFGRPPKGNANFAWVQHLIHHLSPSGTAGFVLANGSMSSDTSGEGETRKGIIEADLVDCMIALPSQLFYNAAIPACLWFISRDKKNHKFKDKCHRLRAIRKIERTFSDVIHTLEDVHSFLWSSSKYS
jgi:type I restriction enzyme M protein